MNERLRQSATRCAALFSHVMTKRSTRTNPGHDRPGAAAEMTWHVKEMRAGMDAPDFNFSWAVWRTSSFNNGGGARAEIAEDQPGIVAVRDFEDREDPFLAFGRGDRRTFASRINDEWPPVT